MIETEELKILKGDVEWTSVPSESGAGQTIARCPHCRVAVWSIYLAAPPRAQQRLRTLRVGTLDNASLCPPNIHIWTKHKQPWIVLPDDALTVAAGVYDWKKLWPQSSVERRLKLLGQDDPL